MDSNNTSPSPEKHSQQQSPSQSLKHKRSSIDSVQELGSEEETKSVNLSNESVQNEKNTLSKKKQSTVRFEDEENSVTKIDSKPGQTAKSSENADNAENKLDDAVKQPDSARSGNQDIDLPDENQLAEVKGKIRTSKTLKPREMESLQSKSSESGASATNAMVTRLSQQITEGMVEKVKTEIMQKIMSDEAYHEMLNSKIKNVLSDSVNKKPDGDNVLLKGITKVVGEQFEDASGKLDKRIKTLETVLFKTSEQERSRLFDHIYEKIANSRKESENDDKKLQSAIDLHTKKLASFELKIEASDRKTADVQELCQQVTRDYAKTNENVQEWYNEFMTKVTNQHK